MLFLSFPYHALGPASLRKGHETPRKRLDASDGSPRTKDRNKKRKARRERDSPAGSTIENIQEFVASWPPEMPEPERQARESFWTRAMASEDYRTIRSGIRRPSRGSLVGLWLVLHHGPSNPLQMRQTKQV
jgi:hypothetical protein